MRPAAIAGETCAGVEQAKSTLAQQSAGASASVPAWTG
jgi:hypothetical protein